MNALEQIAEGLLNRIPEVKGIYLFGSRAQGTEQPESDYDIAFLRPDNLPCLTALELFEISSELYAASGLEINLVDLNGAQTDFRFQIVAFGQRIYCPDPTACDVFEMTCYSIYQKMEEERRGVIDAIKERGFVRARLNAFPKRYSRYALQFT